MKQYRLFVLMLALVLSAALVFASGKDDTKAKTEKKANCCAMGTKASLKSDVKDGKQCDMSSKECKTMSAKECSAAMSTKECTAADKEHCAMSATKASLKKTGTKMDCCKDKAKASETKNSSKQQKSPTDSKGTD